RWAMIEPGGASSYLDEDAGSLDSAGRRLALSEDEQSFLSERVRVLADVGQFLDEFFQLTGGHLRAAASVPGRGDAVRLRVQRLLARQSDALERLRWHLTEAGVELCHWAGLSDADRQSAGSAFQDRLLPVLVPLVSEPGRPLPSAANLSINLAVDVRDAEGRRRFGSVEIPPVVPRFLRLRARPGRPGVRVVPVEQVVAAHLSTLFPAEQVEAYAVFRVTRQAGIRATTDVGDMLTSVERQLRLDRHGPAVRLEVEPQIPGDTLDRLMGELDLARREVYPVGGLVGMADLAALPLPDGPEPIVRRPVAPAGLRSGTRRSTDVFEALDDGDILVHYPYESYTDSVVALLDRASADPALLAIKQTLYRPSPDGPTVRALVRAAERGSHVVAVVELAARLDERNSVACARALERAGGHVVYGLVGLRTHCPLTLVIRDAGSKVSRYGVAGTGLHHPTRRPEGVSLLTADPEITADLTDLFNYLTGYSRPARFRKLLVGPGHLRARLLELIRRETAAGPAGRIALKVYRLVDREVIDALYRASQRGVRIDLVVSGACALRPGVPGLSDGIRVVAPVGRHFETSRLFVFGSGESSSWFLSSGDLALAHLDRQVDVAVPVEDPVHRARLETTLDILLRLPAWEMDGDGAWERRGAGAEEALRQVAASAGTPGGGGASLR
ncbi:MAG TPA: polyphosphate kinase 1, partial [Acidimicrobiia bacterium]|nr:polyphosphate kinase 1 [Acidimicrobiia bacterium]